MHYYRVTIAYKGSRYFGWQAQSSDTSDEEKPTVEGTLLNALKTISRHQPCTLSCASRTDGGVHAQGQVAKISIAKEINPQKLLQGLNSLLPVDIRILSCAASSKDYQPNRSSVSKEYHYYFNASAVDNVATGDIALHLPLSFKASSNIGCNNNKPDDLDLLRSACRLFIGRHDFYNFSSRDKNIASSVREVFYCEIHQADFLPLVDSLYYLKIIGDGFLKHMIRYLMGALIALSKGRITLDDIAFNLQQHQDGKLSPKAKAKGLHLIRIEE